VTYQYLPFIDELHHARPFNLAGQERLVISSKKHLTIKDVKMWLAKHVTALALVTAIGHATCQEQKPLTDETASEPFFTLREQSYDLCDAGSRQWTGTVNVTAEKSMFFCTYTPRNLNFRD
jgi:hypothetical protein